MKQTTHHCSRSMAIITVALSLLLCLAFCISALAEVGTVFPWLSYTLDVALVTADPELVEFRDAPDGGVMVMVKLVSLSGTIQMTDIRERSLDISLRDGNGDEYPTTTWQVRGLENAEGGGFPKIKEEQDAFELLFFLKGKDESAIAGAKLVVPTEVQGERIIVPLDKAPHDAATQSAGDGSGDESAEDSALSFVIGDVRYTISALDDEPKFQLPNRMDGKEGHVVAFSYPVHGSDAEAANKLLYSGARLRQPNGDLVRAYSNSDNIGNPYELYFGLSDGVMLADCVFTITGDDGEVEIPLLSLGDESANTADEPQVTPVVTATPEPTPEPTEEPEAERDANTFAYTVGDKTYELALLDVAYDKEEKSMAVEIVLYDHELLDFIWDKELHMPFGCGIISEKDGFQYTEGVTATVSTPMHMTFNFDTKTLPDLVCFGKLNQEEYKASEDFALVDPENNQFVATFPLTGLLEKEKEPEEILDSVGKGTDELDALTEKTEEPEAGNETDKSGAASTQPTTTAPAADMSEEERKIADALMQCAEGVKDEWQLAIYGAGLRELQSETEDGKTVYTFLLRGFDPALKELGKFNDDNQHSYWADALANAGGYALEASLTYEDGEFTAKSLKALQSTVKKAASASQKAFKDKQILYAVAYELFYDSFGAKVKKAEDIVMPSDAYVQWAIRHMEAVNRLSAQQWTAFFYGQVKQALDVSGGPFAMKLNCTCIDMAELMEKAKADALDKLKYMDYDNRWAQDQMEYEFLLALADNAITMKKKGKDAFTVTLNVDGEPFYGEEYTQRLAAYGYEEALSELENDALSLPEYPAKAFPSAGWMSGSKSGTQVKIKAPKDSVAYYVQLRNYHNDEIAVAGFVQPGKTCTLRVPKGDYYFVMTSGHTWYGEKYLFGDDTNISKTGLFEVASSNYYHTVTLKVVEGGNIPIYGADEDDLR